MTAAERVSVPCRDLADWLAPRLAEGGSPHPVYHRLRAGHAEVRPGDRPGYFSVLLVYREGVS